MNLGVDYGKLLFGENAVHVPNWMWVQHQGPGIVSFVGASKVEPDAQHPLRFGSPRTHHFVLGELLVRPKFVVGTDALRGHGLAGLFSAGPFAALDLVERGGAEVLLGDRPPTH